MFSLKRFWPLLILTFLVLLFFSKLFFPPSFFSTPGDIAYFHLPLKTILSNSLKNGQLPLWTNLIGGGFPIFAESQIGALFLPNIVLFSIFPLWLAFALSYVVIFLISSISTYLFIRKIGASEVPSLFGAVAFSFSMFFVSRIQHLHFIQVVSLMPLCFLFLESFLQTKRVKFLLFFSLVLSQQLFVGFPQAVLYSLFAYIFYFFFRLGSTKKKEEFSWWAVLKNTFFLGLFILIGFGLSSMQLLPNYELLQNSSRSGGLEPNTLFSYSGNPKTLITLVFPYFFGNPSTGTYQSTKELGFYWENAAYSGILTLIFALLSVLLFSLKRKKIILRLYILFFSLLFLFSLLFTMGKYGPFGFFFYLPPLSYFRIPARFLFLTSFSMAVLAALFIQNIFKTKKRGRNFWPKAFLIILVLDLFYYGFYYNPVIKKNTYFYTPKMVEALKNDKTIFRISTLRYLSNPRISRQNLFWKNNNTEYIENFEALDPNLNAVFGVESFDYYTSIETNRMYFLRNFLASNTYMDEEGFVNFLKPSMNIINAQNIKYILTSFQLKGTQFKKIGEETFQHFNKLYLFQNLSALPRAFIVYQYKTVKNFDELKSALMDENYSPERQVLLERKIDFVNKTNSPEYRVDITKYNDQEVELEVNLKEPGILVLANSFYPSWRAFVDNQETQIMPANINQQAIMVGQGKHKITFSYDPVSLRIGIIISLLTIGLLLTGFLLIRKSNRFKNFLEESHD